jgi:hypothetical protein
MDKKLKEIEGREVVVTGPYFKVYGKLEKSDGKAWSVGRIGVDKFQVYFEAENVAGIGLDSAIHLKFNS